MDRLLCGLESGLQQIGAGSDPTGIPITWIIMIFPIEKKQLSKRNSIASLSNDLVKMKWYPIFLDDHDVQSCFLLPCNS